MPTVNFYLKKPEGDPPKSLIYLQMRYRGEKFVYSVGENVEPKYWDKDKQVVKARSQTTKDGKVNLNTLLADLKANCLNAYNTQIASGIPTNRDLKAALDAVMNRKVNKESSSAAGSTFFDLIDRFIAGEFGKVTAGTIRTYKVARMNLSYFQTDTGYRVDFDTITLDFKFKYVTYLEKEKKRIVHGKKQTVKGLSPNSIGKEIKNVKTFMNMAVELGLTTNLAFKSKKFGVKGEETDAVYLTEKEIAKLYRFNFRDNKRLEAVRDLFVFSSCVGLRYSDASTIKPENIVKIDGDHYIKIISKKTGTPVTIPCNEIVLGIFKKYEHNKNRLPPAVSNQKYNDYLKELCEIAGFTETGRLATDLSKPLYKCITSHTARRNFATNCYLSGMDSRMIMAVTGHSTEKSFEKYIKVTRVETAKRMGEHMKKGQSQRNLKAII